MPEKCTQERKGEAVDTDTVIILLTITVILLSVVIITMLTVATILLIKVRKIASNMQQISTNVAEASNWLSPFKVFAALSHAIKRR